MSPRIDDGQRGVVGQQAASLAGGHGQHHPVDGERADVARTRRWRRAPRRCHRPGPAARCASRSVVGQPSERLDGHPGVHGDPPGRQGGGQLGGQPGGAAVERPEDRRRRRPGRTGSGWPGDGGGAETLHEAARQPVGSQQRREGGLGAEVVDAAGVDPADQRVDQALDHLVAEPGLDHCPPRPGRPVDPRIRPVGTDQVEPRPAADRPGRGCRTGPAATPGGDAQVQPVGHHPQPAPRPQRRAPAPRGRPGRRCSPSSLHSCGGLGPPGQEGVGGHVDGPPAELGGADLAAGPAAGLEDDDPRARSPAPRRGPDQLPRGGQPGHAATDDGDDRAAGRCVAHVRVDRVAVPSAASRTTLGQHGQERRVVVERGGPGEGDARARRPWPAPRCRGRRGSRGGRRRSRPGRPPRRWLPRPPPAPSRPAGRARSTGRRSVRRSARPSPR